MNKKIGHNQDGIGFIFTNGDGDGGAVLPADDAVDGKGHTGPLVLLNAAVVVGFEVGNLGVLVQGIGLQIHPGGVHMGSADIGALGQGLGADDGKQEALAPVVEINFIAGLYLHAGDSGLKTVGDGLLGCPGSCLPFGLAGIHKGGIPCGIAFHFLPLLGGQTLVSVLLLHQKRGTKFINVHGIFLRFSLLY